MLCVAWVYGISDFFHVIIYVIITYDIHIFHITFHIYHNNMRIHSILYSMSHLSHLFFVACYGNPLRCSTRFPCGMAGRGPLRQLQPGLLCLRHQLQGAVSAKAETNQKRGGKWVISDTLWSRKNVYISIYRASGKVDLFVIQQL